MAKFDSINDVLTEVKKRLESFQRIKSPQKWFQQYLPSILQVKQDFQN